MTTSRRRCSILLGLLVCMPVGVAGCDEASITDGAEIGSETGSEAGTETGPDDSDPADLGLAPSSVTWVFDWDGIAGLDLENDLGYPIHVDVGWVGTWGVTLIDCTSADRSPSEPRGDGTGVASPWLVQEGHTTGADDPSAWVFAGVESLTEQLPVTAPVIELSGTRYCQTHYLLAPISDASVGFDEAQTSLGELDPSVDLAGASLVVIGSWEPPGGGEPTPFVFRSEQAYGKILELELSDDGLGPAADGVAVEVEVRRELAHMFDGVEFATADPDAASWLVLGNLAKHTRSLVRTTP